MNYLSIFSGIESATVAWRPLGWTAFAFAEIDPFPCAVLAHHYGSNLNGEKFSRNAPPNLGDVRNFKRWPVSEIDILIGGSPCQSFSVAGLRQGLADPRGNLALTYLAIANKYRPRWIVWENVPGVLSSKQGRDFGAFLGGLAQLGYGIAYRVLDAQYVRVDLLPYAVPQQRRRVFVVGYLGDWRRAAAVLFDAQGLQGDYPTRRQTGQVYTTDVAPSLISSGRGVERAGETRGQDPVVAVSGAVSSKWAKQSGGPAGDECYNLVVASTVKTSARNPSTKEGLSNPIIQQQRVRRLIPRECEKLQGLPDNYTLVPYRGKPATDSPRYKALGNAMATNCINWLGRRIEWVESLQ